MKILNLIESSKIYTSNVYLVLGTWNAIEDVNTLVDVGRDPMLLEKINTAPTGVGKQKVSQVVLTHSHYDHTSLLPEIKAVFKPFVKAFSPFIEGVDHLLKDGELIKIGDRTFEVLHTPGHSSDSICLVCEEEGILFTGDSPIMSPAGDSTYEDGFLKALEKISSKDIRGIYPGHGNPLLEGCNERICDFVKNIRLKRRQN